MSRVKRAQALFPAFADVVSQNRPPPGVLRYGTAGFRMKGEILDSTALRMGILAALRSKKLENNAIGVMITASHNPIADNGIKLVDPDGGMMDMSWEKHAERLANAAADTLANTLDEIAEEEEISLELPCTVFIGRDSRPTGEKLSELVRDGALLIGGNVLDFGLATTPQTHSFVRFFNQGHRELACETGYYSSLADAMKKALTESGHTAIPSIIIDAANSVVAPKLIRLQSELGDLLKMEVRNTGEEGVLNLNCGAEHVHKTQSLPETFEAADLVGKRCCAVDGDGDRLVYFFVQKPEGGEEKMVLLDGDRLASLTAGIIRDLLVTAGLSDVRLGIVQTAYANGASTAYLKGKLGVEVGLAKTGVKYVHHLAAQYDIGVYFESNGHGTVLFKEATVERMTSMVGSERPSKAQKVALQRLIGLSELFNQGVGDATADMLAIETMLLLKRWTLQQWADLYADLPCRQSVVQVPDRSVIKTNDTETRVVSPVELQEAVDAIVAEFEGGRAFVRPSGTEDVVRVYAEGRTPEDVEALSAKVGDAVKTILAPTATA